MKATKETERGMTAELELAGAPVDAFGKDVKNLILEVEYQSEHRTSSSKPFACPGLILA